MEGLTGIRRKVDDLGRVVVPSAIRKAVGLAEGDEVAVSLDGDRIVLERAQPRCVFCGADDETETFRDKAVCWSCMAAVRALDRERQAESATPFPF